MRVWRRHSSILPRGGVIKLRELWAIIRKEFLQIRRDPRTLGIILFAPVIMLVLYGYAVDFEIKNIAIVVCDQDQTRMSREFINGLTANNYFELKENVTDPEQLLERLDAGTAKAVLWLPSGFEAKLLAAQEGQIFLGIDGSDANTATISMGYLSGYTRIYSNKLSLQNLQRTGMAELARGLIPYQVEQRIWYNPEMKSAHFIIPGLISTLLMMLVSLLTAMAITGEKERNTFEQLAASPIKAWQLILGKLIPYALVSFGGVLLIIPAGILLFQVPLRGNLLILFFFTMIFLIATLGIGLLISTIAKSQQQAMLMAASLTAMPAVLLSGFVFPIESMPKFLQLITNLIPAKFFLVALRGIFLKGIGLDLLYQQAIALMIFALVLLIVASLRFKKRLD